MVPSGTERFENRFALRGFGLSEFDETRRVAVVENVNDLVPMGLGLLRDDREVMRER
jgi:hypothetical protein